LYSQEQSLILLINTYKKVEKIVIYGSILNRISVYFAFRNCLNVSMQINYNTNM